MTPLPNPDELGRMTGTEIRAVLLASVRDELEACAKIADEMADRLARSGKHDEGMVAVTLAARLRERIRG